MEHKKELEDLLEHLMSEGGSDIHFSVDHPPIIRVSGFLIPLVNYQLLTKEDTEAFMKLLLKQDDHPLFLDKKELDFSYDFKNKARFRGNCYFQKGSIAIALRFIPKQIRSIADLGLPKILESFTQLQQGFFLVVGPMGHGKSTTLAAMVELINRSRAEHIITIEDPVEYVFEPKSSFVDQREVRQDTDGFTNALTSAFRQDADVILIGEMREIETISAAVTAAETGHLVFSTLHTNNASQTIDRIIDSFPSTQQDQVRVQLSASLTGIFSQRLIPRISGGLIPAYELLINDTAVSNLIRENRTHEIANAVETGAQRGMIDMNRCLAELVRKGEITAENAFLYSLNPKSLERLI
jgi:twitching motility protein PilT